MKNFFNLLLLLNITCIIFASEKKDWIFVAEMPEKKDQEKDIWRIKEKKLFLNLNEVEPIYYTDTYAELIEEAKNQKVPFFLIMLQTDLRSQNENLNLYSKNIFISLVKKWSESKWLHEELPKLSPKYPTKYPDAFFADPLTNSKVQKITIFIMDPSYKKFIQLNKNSDIDYLKQFVTLKKAPPPEVVAGTPTQYYEYELNQILNTPGFAQFFIATLFEKQKLFEQAFQWYEWAMQYLPKESEEYKKAEKESKKILGTQQQTNWIFVTEKTGSKTIKQGDLWQIKDEKLYLNKNELEPISQETFNELIQESQKNNLPFFLVMLQGNSNIYFYSGEYVFKFLIEKWRESEFIFNKKMLPNAPPAYFANPTTNEKIDNISIFVMNKNYKNFTLLKSKADATYIEKFVIFEKMIQNQETLLPEYTYTFKKILTNKGFAQFFIATLFEKQKLFEQAFQWYEWAMQYLPKESEEYKKAEKESKKILGTQQQTNFKTLLLDYINKANAEKNKGNTQQALIWYGKAADVNTENEPEKSEFVKLKKLGKDKIEEAASSLKNAAKYSEAKKIYELAPNEFKIQIKTLNNEIPYEKQIQTAINLAKEKKFSEALDLLKKLPDPLNPTTFLLETDILKLPDVYSLQTKIKNDQTQQQKKEKKTDTPPKQNNLQENLQKLTSNLYKLSQIIG